MKKTSTGLLLGAVAAGTAAILSACGGSDGTANAATLPKPSMEKFLTTLREPAPGLADFTVYRPADLSAVGGSVPVLLWANGACKSSNHRYWDVLGAISARGYVVVAYGAASQVTFNETHTVTPARMQRSLDWVVNQAKSQPGYEMIDTSKIGVFGTSCGGLEALVAGADPRVKSVGAINTGFFDAGSQTSINQGGYSVADIAKLHAPTLFMGGGPSDIAYAQTHSNYNAAKVKTVLAENVQGGHGGFWVGLRYQLSDDQRTATGSAVDYSITTEAVSAMVRWFDYTLNGNLSEMGYFVGADSGLGKVPGWTVQSKNF